MFCPEFFGSPFPLLIIHPWLADDLILAGVAKHTIVFGNFAISAFIHSDIMSLHMSPELVFVKITLELKESQFTFSVLDVTTALSRPLLLPLARALV